MLSASRPAACVLFCGIVVILEHVGQRHRADFEARPQQSLIREELQHMRAETAHRAFFDGDQERVIARQLAYEIVVKWLGKTRVGHRHADAGCLPGAPAAISADSRRPPRLQDRNVFAFDEHASAADGEDFAALGQGTPVPSPRGKRNAIGPSL